MNYKLMRPLKIREAVIIIQSQFFWLGASPDGLVFDKKNQEISLLAITRNLSIESTITDKKFYTVLNKYKKLYLKRRNIILQWYFAILLFTNG